MNSRILKWSVLIFVVACSLGWIVRQTCALVPIPMMTDMPEESGAPSVYVEQCSNANLALIMSSTMLAAGAGLGGILALFMVQNSSS